MIKNVEPKFRQQAGKVLTITINSGIPDEQVWAKPEVDHKQILDE
jgi:hypothetical protein